MSAKDERTVQVAISIFVLFVGMSTVLSLVLPDRTESYPQAMRMLADFVATAVPSIEGFVLISSFPVVTKMFLAAQWLMVPVLAALISRYPSVVEPNQRTLRRFSRFKLVLLLVALLAFCVVGPATIAVQPEDLVGRLARARAFILASESRLCMGLIGSSVIF